MAGQTDWEAYELTQCSGPARTESACRGRGPWLWAINYSLTPAASPHLFSKVPREELLLVIATARTDRRSSASSHSSFSLLPHAEARSNFLLVCLLRFEGGGQTGVGGSRTSEGASDAPRARIPDMVVLAVPCLDRA